MLKKMEGIIIFLLSLHSGVYMFQQSDYFIDYERMDVVSYNKDYLAYARIVTFKYNRTHPVINVTVTVAADIKTDIEIIAQAYTFLSNEYRQFPLRFSFKLCDSIAKNDFGLGEIYKHGNFSGCPIKKVTYCIYNWAPDSSRFPPYIPNGRYMIELQAIYYSTELAVVRGYGIVSRPLGRRH